MTNEFEDMGDDQAEFEALGDEFEQRYRPARDWYTDEDVTNGGTAWTPTLEHLFDFMGVKQLQTRDINYLIQRFKLIRCLVPVTYFKEYWYGEKVIENPELERPVVKRDDEGKPVKKKGSDEYEVSKETVSEKVDPVIKRFRMMKKIVENKDGILELKMIEDKSSGQEEEGVNFYLVPVNEEGDKAVIGRKPTQDERDWVKEHYPDAKEETFWALDDHHSESETQEREVFYKTPKAFLRLSKRYWNRLRRRDPDWVIPKEHWVYGGLEHPDRLIPELSDRLINERGDVTIGALNEFEFLHFVKYFADHYFFEAEVRYTWQKLVRANAIRYLSRKGELTDKSLYDYMEEKAYDWWPPDRLIDFVDTMVEDPRRFDREPDPDDPDADFELSHRPAERAWSRFESLSCLRHIVRLPTHRGYKNLDWSNSLIKYLTYEELRDLPNGHFRMSRHGVWVFGTGEYTLADAKRAVGDDWGGRESKGIWGNNWVFSECDKLTPQPEPLPESPTKAEVEAWNTATRARRDLMMAVAGFGPNDQKETVSAFYLAYGGYRANVGEGAGAIRGLLVHNREGTMVTADDFRKNYLTKCRDYDRGEIGILLRQVIFFLFPRDVGKNQNGFRPDNMVADLNSRIAGVLRDPDNGTPKVVIVQRIIAENRRDDPNETYNHYKSRRNKRYVNFFDQTGIIQRVWEDQPCMPVVKWMEGNFGGWKRRNVMHFRPEIDKMLDGLPITPELLEHLERWYEMSDERIWNFVYWYSAAGSGKDSISAAEGFSIEMASRLCQDGFGLGYGPEWIQQERQERLLEVGLKSRYYTTMKGILEWWSVRKTAVRLKVQVNSSGGVEGDRTWPDINELKLKIAGHLENRSLIWILAKNVLWPQLIKSGLLAKDEPFPRLLKEVNELDWGFVMEELNPTCGNLHIPSVSAATNAQEGGDSSEMELRNSIIGDNHERFIAIQKGLFFSNINQESQ